MNKETEDWLLAQRSKLLVKPQREIEVKVPNWGKWLIDALIKTGGRPLNALMDPQKEEEAK
jgi:hypothetical protein